jgi:hypothetical protein
MRPFSQLFLFMCFFLPNVVEARAQCAYGPPPTGIAGDKPTLPSRYVAGQQGPSGGDGGGYCPTNDVNPFWRLSSISANSGSSIDAFDLTFEIPAIPGNLPQIKHVHCGGDGGTLDAGPEKCAGRPNNTCGVLSLAADEHIVRVLGHYGNFVDNLYIQTSNGQFRYFGNQHSRASGTFDYIAPEGAIISGLVVRCGNLVDAVGVVLHPSR